MDTNVIAEWCANGLLPDSEKFFETILSSSRQYSEAEGIVWDFKQTWPFSFSDDYFAGICRLICAFSNSRGGIIIFGVHDEKRTGGHNKVLINLDKFNKAVEQLLGALPPLAFKSFANAEAGDVDVLLVKPRPDGIAPYRFKKQIGNYKAGAIWVRVGHEVKLAEPVNYPLLFCRTPIAELNETTPLDGSIPPSPATLKQKFVGRTEVLDRLFHWLEASDEPRTYLHGKGGSGKTTIAYEFARLLKENGRNLRIYGNDHLDTVIFVSAKEKSLSVVDAKVVDSEYTDFANEHDLLSAILSYGEWTRDAQYLKNATLEMLRAEIKEFFDLNSILLVIDDIDTLTTRGIDPGSDFIYKVLCRATRTSKVVYTLRNAPTQSLANAIEVPGLSGEDYERFVKECVDHFQVPAPSADFQRTKLSEISERRPLVIESVIALRRTCSNYDQAIDLFQQQTGDAIRDYVFLREWDSLDSNSPRLLLAALSEFGEPTGFRDLHSVLQFEQSAISDAIGAVREMFLQIDQAGNETLYTLAPLTRAFIKGKRSQLVGYNYLHQRIKAFQRSVAISNPRVAAIATQVERLIPTRFSTQRPEKVTEAFRIVSDKTLPPYVTEDPLFRTVLGYVLACQHTPNLSAMRDAFEYSIKMKSEPDFKYLRAWYNAEKNSGVNDGWSIRVADLVLDGKRYSEREKMEMIGRKAVSLYARAKERIHTDPSDAFKDLRDSLCLHLRAFRLYSDSGDIRASNSERFARDNGFFLLSTLAKSSVAWEFMDVLQEVADGGDSYLDPLISPIFEATDLALKAALKPDGVARTRQRLKSVKESVISDKNWLDRTLCHRVAERLKWFEAQLEQRSRIVNRSNSSARAK